jgi:hypothetical protein
MPQIPILCMLGRFLQAADDDVVDRNEPAHKNMSFDASQGMHMHAARTLHARNPLEIHASQPNYAQGRHT